MVARQWWPAGLIGLLAAGATIAVYGTLAANPYREPTPVLLWLASRLSFGPHLAENLVGGVHGAEELPIPVLVGIAALINALACSMFVAALMAIARRWRRAGLREHAA